jgi:hypothetical protein
VIVLVAVASKPGTWTAEPEPSHAV